MSRFPGGVSREPLVNKVSVSVLLVWLPYFRSLASSAQREAEEWQVWTVCGLPAVTCVFSKRWELECEKRYGIGETPLGFTSRSLLLCHKMKGDGQV